MSDNKFDVGLTWYIILVVLVLFLSLTPTKPYLNKWQNILSFADSAGREQDPKLRAELAKEGLEKIAPIYKEFPYHPRIQMSIGYLYFMRNDLDSALYYTNMALNNGKDGVVNSIVPFASQIIVNATLNKSLSLIMAGDTLQAIKLYQDALEYAPQNPILNKNLALYYLNNKEFDKSISYYRTALRSNNNDDDIMNGLARCYLHLGIKDSVLRYTNLVLSKNPNNQEARSIQNIINQ